MNTVRNVATSPLVPVGTQVVTRVATPRAPGELPRPRGAVGVVAAQPAGGDERYRLRLVDGGGVLLRRPDFAVRKLDQSEGVRQRDDLPSGFRVEDWVVYRCVVGSTAYGLAEPGSDLDRRGIYLPPAELHWSLQGVPEQVENDATEEVYWELQKFLVLALKANPNVLECLHTPVVELATPLAEELLAMRSVFLSKLVYQTYNGYVVSQFRKLEQDLRNRGEIRWKHAMHLVRLLLAGVAVLRDGLVPVEVPTDQRERLLAIRRGEVPWAEIDAWRLELHRAFDAAYEATMLPERPDYERVDAFLVRARRSMVR
jgi:uncharacterized protein